MKKTKLMHTLLALALSYGTFASQAMASQYSEYDYANYYGSQTAPDLDDNGTPAGYTKITYDQTGWETKSAPIINSASATMYEYYVDDAGNMLLRNNDNNVWYKYESSNADEVNKQYGIGAYAPEPTPEPTTEPTPEPTPTEDTTTYTRMPNVHAPHKANIMYSPSFANISSTGNTVSSMQNIGQSAYATNTANLTNSMNITGMDGSDLVNNMTVNTNAMNSNVGSSYNNSTNDITTDTTNNSTNDYTTTLDSSRTFEVPAV